MRHLVQSPKKASLAYLYRSERRNSTYSRTGVVRKNLAEPSHGSINDTSKFYTRFGFREPHDRFTCTVGSRVRHLLLITVAAFPETNANPSFIVKRQFKQLRTPNRPFCVTRDPYASSVTPILLSASFAIFHMINAGFLFHTRQFPVFFSHFLFFLRPVSL